MIYPCSESGQECIEMGGLMICPLLESGQEWGRTVK